VPIGTKEKGDQNMALYPASAVAEARVQAHRLRLTRFQVYACRYCREAIKVTSAHYLPDTCGACGTSTWEDDGRCADWLHCDAVRRPGVRGRAHCHACGSSVWTLVSMSRAPRG
jgi:hypothetical protein